MSLLNWYNVIGWAMVLIQWSYVLRAGRAHKRQDWDMSIRLNRKSMVFCCLAMSFFVARLLVVMVAR